MGNVKNIESIRFASTTGQNQSTLGLSDTFMTNNNGVATLLLTLLSCNADHKIDGSLLVRWFCNFILEGNTTGKNDTLLGGAGDDVLQIGYKGLAASKYCLI